MLVQVSQLNISLAVCNYIPFKEIIFTIRMDCRSGGEPYAPPRTYYLRSNLVTCHISLHWQLREDRANCHLRIFPLEIKE